MNWLTKAIKFGEKIKKVLKKRPSKEEIENSNWTSCCKGPILKKDLEENLWVCDSCGKHHRISSRQRFDVFFGKNNYEIIKTPIPKDDPLGFEDSKKYTDRLKDARKKTNQDCAVMIARGNVNGINITAGAINFDFIGGSIASAEGEAIITGIQHAIDNNNPFVFFPSGGGQRMMESPIALAQMTRTTLAVNELKKFPKKDRGGIIMKLINNIRVKRFKFKCLKREKYLDHIEGYLIQRIKPLLNTSKANGGRTLYKSRSFTKFVLNEEENEE